MGSKGLSILAIIYIGLMDIYFQSSPHTMSDVIGQAISAIFSIVLCTLYYKDLLSVYMYKCNQNTSMHNYS